MSISIKSETYLNVVSPICAALEKPSVVIAPLWRAFKTISLLLFGLACSGVFILEFSILVAGSRYVDYTPAAWLAGIVVLVITGFVAALSFAAFFARMKPAHGPETLRRPSTYTYD